MNTNKHNQGHFKRYFLRGLAVLLPTMLTIWIFIWGYTFIQESIGIHISKTLVWITTLITDMDKETLTKFWVYGPGSIAGFLLALVFVCIVGLILASVVGKTIWHRIERFILNTPLLKQVYPYIKQITDFMLVKDRKNALFSQVVAVEFPKKGSWALGMVTGTGLESIVKHTGKEFLTVFVATAPSPVTGFIMMVPKDEVIELNMTVEEAVRFIISGGVITPTTKFTGLEDLPLIGDSEQEK